LIQEKFVKELTAIMGRDNVLFSRKDLLAYSYDSTSRQEMPEIVVFPRSTAEVSALMKAAHREKIPVIARGAGTNLSGGTIPDRGGIILELSRMNHILEIDPANRRAVVQPGVVNLDLQNALAPLDFVFPPDPASQKTSTLGGNVGENAGGPHCLKYGVTSKYICGMEVVLASGEVIDVGGHVEDNPGYLVIFDTLEKASQTVSDIIGAGIIPGALELLDKTLCQVIEQGVSAGYPTDAEAVLLIELEGLADSLERQIKDISTICQQNKTRELRIAQTAEEKAALWQGRRGAFGAIARICPQYVVMDGTVPRNKMVAAMRQVGEIARKHQVTIANVAHAGDGNLHPLILFDINSEAQQTAARNAGEDILKVCLDMGGTITGEHGVGLEKLHAMPTMFSPADLAAMRQVKKVFDPDDILNPGKLLPSEEGESHLEEKEVAA
jgi:glycolate oxidase